VPDIGKVGGDYLRRARIKSVARQTYVCISPSLGFFCSCSAVPRANHLSLPIISLDVGLKLNAIEFLA
jgi:hypothetical protein